MELIYQERYETETMDEANVRLSETAPILTNAIQAHRFFAAQDEDARASFLALADTCNQLAAHENAEIEIFVTSEENTATIVLTAPCFLFQIRQIALLQKIGACVSELVFDVTDEQTSQIIASFDFSQKNDKLYQQFQRLFFKK